MEAYGALAESYDRLTNDVDYGATVEFYDEILKREGVTPRSVADLACGTGSVGILFAQRGLRVIGVDISEEMLTVAAQKAMAMEHPPFFVRQKMQNLRLPQPVDAVVCLLDSLNYLDEPADCRKTLTRVFENLAPGGVFLFDINTPAKLRALDGQVFLDENEDSYCVWRAEFDREENRCYYGIDLFRRAGKLWQRSFEQHCEYAYEPQTLCRWLEEAGFSRVEQFGDCRLSAPMEGEQRIYFAAYKEEMEP